MQQKYKEYKRNCKYYLLEEIVSMECESCDLIDEPGICIDREAAWLMLIKYTAHISIPNDIFLTICILYVA